METINIIEGLDAAIRLLSNARKPLAHGSQAIFNLSFHAENHLDKQIKELLADNPRHDGIDGHCADECPCLVVGA